MISKQQITAYQLRQAVSDCLASSSLSPFPSLTGEAYAEAVTVWEEASTQRSSVLQSLRSLALGSLGAVLSNFASRLKETSAGAKAPLLRILSIGCGDAFMDLKIVQAITESLKQRSGQQAGIDYVGLDLNPCQVCIWLSLKSSFYYISHIPG